MKASPELKKLFRQWEGLESAVYFDSGGELTIGIGHLLTRAERLSGKIAIGDGIGSYRDGLTEAQCWQLLDQDLEPAEAAINRRCPPLTQNQFDALVSFVFNVGVSAFTESTLLKLLTRGEYAEVPTQLRRWIHDNGAVVPGLINRREKEIALWNSKVIV